jgi:hypothetical protein
VFAGIGSRPDQVACLLLLLLLHDDDIGYGRLRLVNQVRRRAGGQVCITVTAVYMIK